MGCCCQRGGLEGESLKFGWALERPWRNGGENIPGYRESMTEGLLTTGKQSVSPLGMFLVPSLSWSPFSKLRWGG